MRFSIKDMRESAMAQLGQSLDSSDNPLFLIKGVIHHGFQMLDFHGKCGNVFSHFGWRIVDAASTGASTGLRRQR